MAVPYIFAASTSAIPLANLDSNFAYFANAITVSSGNVGIGTNSPSQKLDVVGSNVVVKSSASSGFGSFYANGATGSQSHYFFGINSTETARISSDANNYLYFSTGSASTERMRIDSSGNVGIGTSSPAAKLDIISGTARMYFSNQSATAFFTAVNTSNSAYAPMAINGSELILKTGDAERARINSSGNLLVGTTNATLGSGTGLKVVAGTNAAERMEMGSSITTNLAVGYSMYSTGASAYRFYVGYGGTIYATSTTITAISDQRLKENIQDLDVGLEKIMALKPRKFDWKSGKGKDKKNDRGWIAQEFEQVFPDMIDTWADPAPEGEEPYKAVNADLIPVLVKAIQEQQAIIEQLKARLDAANL